VKLKGKTDFDEHARTFKSEGQLGCSRKKWFSSVPLVGGRDSVSLSPANPIGEWHVVRASPRIPLPADDGQWIPARAGFLDLRRGNKLGRAGLESS